MTTNAQTLTRYTVRYVMTRTVEYTSDVECMARSPEHAIAIVERRRAKDEDTFDESLTELECEGDAIASDEWNVSEAWATPALGW